MLAQLRTSALMLLVLTLITGVIYPLAITGLSQAIFPKQANGSLIITGGTIRGSELIGQPFDDPKYFWGRPSATAPAPYSAAASTGSNLAVSNPAQRDAIKARAERLRAADPGNTQAIPVDLVTASGSGLDPHISPTAARYQVARVARVRGLAEEAVLRLLAEHTQGRQFGLLGEPVVNVLQLNRALDGAAPPAARTAP